MTNTPNRFARFQGASIQHLLIEGTMTTACGKDATFAHRYPFLTAANSNDRRTFRTCARCLDNPTGKR
jgi:hypothetical protein